MFSSMVPTTPPLSFPLNFLLCLPVPLSLPPFSLRPSCTNETPQVSFWKLPGQLLVFPSGSHFSLFSKVSAPTLNQTKNYTHTLFPFFSSTFVVFYTFAALYFTQHIYIYLTIYICERRCLCSSSRALLLSSCQVLQTGSNSHHHYYHHYQQPLRLPGNEPPP